eukprot:5117786-Prymnesium_polylepis.2
MRHRRRPLGGPGPRKSHRPRSAAVKIRVAASPRAGMARRVRHVSTSAPVEEARRHCARAGGRKVRSAASHFAGSLAHAQPFLRAFPLRVERLAWSCTLCA